jgi:Zn-dependent peptidase ImmA (M78 family)/transcriptional regulator with XRE-family HTH domain
MPISRSEIGRRLRALREAIGFTQADVASKLGMHRPTITEIEAGRRAVSSEELAQFADLYATPIWQVLETKPPELESGIAVLARGFGADRPEAQRAIRLFLKERREERELEQVLGIQPSEPSVRVRYAASPPATKFGAVLEGQQMAEQERTILGLGNEPVRSVLELLRRQGVTIGPLPEGEEIGDLDGFYLETTDIGPCVAVNTGNTEAMGSRATFTAAHEYAHWLLQDRQAEVLRVGASGDGDHVEVRANAFAAAFLMPPNGLRGYLADRGLLEHEKVPRLSPGDVVRAMHYFGVSRIALLLRLMNLKFIAEQQKELLKDFPVGKTAKALGIKLEPREEVLDRRKTLALRAWRQGLVSASRAASLCGLTLEAFRELVTGSGETQDEADDAALVGAAAS